MHEETVQPEVLTLTHTQLRPIRSCASGLCFGTPETFPARSSAWCFVR